MKRIACLAGWENHYQTGKTLSCYNYPITNPPWEDSLTPEFDMSFRTYVVPEATPEPSAAVLMLLAIVASGLKPRRRRAVKVV
jgi:hypothetical protein